MIHIFLNGLGASAGAGLTYLFNVVPHLSANPAVRTTLAIQPKLRREFKSNGRLVLAECNPPSSSAVRFWFEQRTLPKLIRNSGADVLISAGNFAVKKSPVPQMLLSGNSLYTSSDFERDLLRRREFGMLLDNRVKGFFARKAIYWADRAVAPSRAFADQLQHWTGRQVAAIHHGFDHELFIRDQSPLPEHVCSKLFEAKDTLKLLFVSHYNYYRNFETLFRSIPLIKARLGPRKVRLFLTCTLQDGANPGAYRAAKAAALVEQLGIREEVVQLGTIPYRSLHHLYRACDIYVTPAYTETFAHPLVEAMASGLPIVASDLRVHREVTAGAACYFPVFSPEALAERVVEVATTAGLATRLSEMGKQWAKNFSWEKHVDQLLDLAASIQHRSKSKAAHAA